MHGVTIKIKYSAYISTDFPIVFVFSDAFN